MQTLISLGLHASWLPILQSEADKLGMSIPMYFKHVMRERHPELPTPRRGRSPGERVSATNHHVYVDLTLHSTPEHLVSILDEALKRGLKVQPLGKGAFGSAKGGRTVPAILTPDQAGAIRALYSHKPEMPLRNAANHISSFASLDAYLNSVAARTPPG